MGVVVFDAGVLIAFLSASDTHHNAAVAVIREATAHARQRVVSAISYSELLVWPFRDRRAAGIEQVDEMLSGLKIEVETVDRELATRAATVRVETGLKLPNAYVVATALRIGANVRLESFDKRVIDAFAKLHPLG